MGNNLLKTLGSLIGLAVGGPAGAALGSGIGTLAGGGDLGDAIESGIGTLFTGALTGRAGIGLDALSGGASAQRSGQNILSMLGGQSPPNVPDMIGPIKGITPSISEGIGNLINVTGLDNPYILSALMLQQEPKGTLLTPLQQEQMRTGERNPDFQGVAALDPRFMKEGGFLEGPGTGKSDSIKGAIYQNGKRVQEARLSDGEFVMTADAVKGAGNGDREKGAARMYEMMNSFERRA